MTDIDAITSLTTLPADATYGEAILWLEKMRRVVDRWDDLPDAHRCSMTPQAKREVHAELDLLEDKIRRDMAAVS